MMKKMLLAAVLALSAAPALAANAASNSRAPVSTDEARAMAGQQIIAQQKAEASQAKTCSCKHG